MKNRLTPGNVSYTHELMEILTFLLIAFAEHHSVFKILKFGSQIRKIEHAVGDMDVEPMWRNGRSFDSEPRGSGFDPRSH